MKSKLIRQVVTIGSGTTAGQQNETTFTLVKAGFNKITGLLANMVKGGGLDNDFEIGLDSPNGDPIIDQINMASFGFITPATDVAPELRYNERVNFPIDNGNYIIKIKTNATTTSNLKLELVFRAEGDC